MNYIIRCEGEGVLNDFLESLSEKEQKAVKIILCSLDLNPKGFNYFKKQLFKYKILVPPPNIIARYISGDIDKSDYKKEVIHFYNNPEVSFYINQLVSELFNNNSILVLACSDLEKDYSYIKILTDDYIEPIYGIDTYSAKKYHKKPDEFKKLNSIRETDCVKIYHKRKDAIFAKIREMNLSLDDYDREAILKRVKNRMSKKGGILKKIKNSIF